MVEQTSVSVFAQMVDKLRNKSEEELKMLYLKFFSDELNEEWKSITGETSFGAVTDEKIVQKIQKDRYKS